ncbi:MAG: UDP-N-acetylmuramate--L-alanine ligase [Ruminococcaceae bacterium]|nr:UDP-N-acetylmuramate--L-alanine ligase [Oscillospiraceae bacterium]
MNEMIVNGNKIHFIGIGGIMMSSLAMMALKDGKQVTGSDRAPSALTEELERRGATVYYGQCAENIEKTRPEVVVYTAAIHPDNEEYAAAVAAGIPMLSRAQYLGRLMTAYRHRIGVSGTHGKSTTTGMLSAICLAGSSDPTVLCGAELACLDGNAFRIGKKEQLVYESCEYTDSFLSFHPTVAVVLNIDLDHVDYFHSLSQMKESFYRSALDAECVVVNLDDANTKETFAAYPKKVITVSIDSEDADYRTKELRFEKGCGVFTLMKGSEALCEIRLSVPGKHNVSNALCAAAAALACGVSADEICKGLFAFGGAVRRFEKKGSVDGVDVYDDYAHHPTEIEATLKTAKTLGYKRVVTVFQSHTYSRTAGLLDEFAAALSHSDLTLVAPIFAAREVNTFGVSAADIAARMENARAFDSMEQTYAALKEEVQKGDLVITMGAGDVYRIGERFLSDGKN